VPTPFAALESRVNTAVLTHLANATATWVAQGGGEPVEADVVAPLPHFVNTDTGLVQVVDQVRVPVATWPGCADGDAVSLRGVDYLVRGRPEVEPTGGLKRVVLVRV
jgi:hypothetical protein